MHSPLKGSHEITTLNHLCALYSAKLESLSSMGRSVGCICNWMQYEQENTPGAVDICLSSTDDYSYNKSTLPVSIQQILFHSNERRIGTERNRANENFKPVHSPRVFFDLSSPIPCWWCYPLELDLIERKVQRPFTAKNPPHFPIGVGEWK